MARMKGHLFGFGEKIVRITIEGHFPDDFHRHQGFWYQLGWVQQVKIKLMLIFFRYELQAEFIFRLIAGFDRFPQIAPMKIRIFTG